MRRSSLIAVMPFLAMTAPLVTASAAGWTNVAPLPTGRGCLAAATGPDGRIYAIGGGTINATPVATVEAYTPGTNSWTRVASLPIAMQCLAAAVSGGRIYAMGPGNDNNGDTLMAYTPGTNGWTTLAPLPLTNNRNSFGAATGPDGRIYAIGGNTPNLGIGAVTNDVEAYRPATNSWARVAPMPTPRCCLAVVTGPDGRIYAMGGDTSGGKGAPATPTTRVEMYTPGTNHWTTVASLPTASDNVGAAVGPDGRIYYIGSTNVYAYTPATNSWAAVVSPIGQNFPAAATGPDGRIYAIGGNSGTSANNSVVEAYDTTPSPPPPTLVVPTATATPVRPSASPVAVASGTHGGTGSGAAPSTIATSLPTPAAAFSSVGRTVVSAAVAAAVVLLITFPAHLFNRTLEENYEDIVAFWRRRAPWLNRARRRLLADRGRRRNLVTVTAVILVGALLGGFLDPHFGFNQSSAATYLAVVISALWGIGVGTLAVFAYRKRRRHDTQWGLRALPAGLFIAAGCVVVSRLSDFQPGYLYGVVCIAVFAGALAKHEQGRALVISTLVTVILAIAAWFAWVPVNAAAAQPGASWPMVELDDVLGAIFAGGLIGSTIGMIPLRFLPGGAIAAWHRGVWAAASLVVTFAFVSIMLNPGRGGHPGRASAVTAIVLFAIFGAGSVLFALYFARRRRAPAMR